MLEPLVLSDSSPARPRDLTLLDQEEAGLVSTFINRPSIDIFKILPSKDDPDWPSFQQILSKFPDTEHLCPDGGLVNNSFILDIALPQKWIDHRVYNPRFFQSIVWTTCYFMGFVFYADLNLGFMHFSPFHIAII
ncbi:hypothetical protein AtNW77_Chr2g0227721 [Arabidopsis thaliana]|uniref:Uncharacterized protein n=1 Tax=Arabidopsis thaliana x Arabidopsis arenosa TaxID=1240361 RepID=A0A8T2FXS9_9BRAS|nr:hypothetical protein ISN45_At02g005420 [Arabidopsis thaliana x Arabidopsis arenosa]